MKRYLYFILLAILLISCSDGSPVVGTWVKSDSMSDQSLGVSMGMVSVLKIKGNGNLEEVYEIQGKAECGTESGGSVSFHLFGKWEMPSEDKLVMHFEKCYVGEQEFENTKDVEYTIINIGKDRMELMSGGDIDIYERKK